jgi:hypothetical protein
MPEALFGLGEFVVQVRKALATKVFQLYPPAKEKVMPMVELYSNHTRGKRRYTLTARGGLS